MNTRRVKRYIMPLFAFFIMLAGARAADYLWEPKLLWESKESYQRDIIGLQFINDDQQVLYSADGKVYVRDAQTGEILKRSTQFDMEMGGFRFSKNNKILYAYGIANFLGGRQYSAILSFDFETMKCLDSISAPIGLIETETQQGIKLTITQLNGVIPISDNKVYLLMETTRLINPNTSRGGYCLISVNPTQKFSWENKDGWKVEYYFDKSSNQPTAPIITRNSEYLIYQGDGIVNFINLASLKIEFNIPGNAMGTLTSDMNYISTFDSNWNGSIYEIKTQKIMFKYDKNAIETLTHKGTWLATNDPSKLFYSWSIGEDFRYYDLLDKKVKGAFEKSKAFYTSLFNYNCKYVLSIVASNKLKLYELNPYNAGVKDLPDSGLIKLDNNRLTIPTNEISSNEIIIFNADGKLIKQYSTFDSDKENIYLDISFLNKGVYFVSVVSNNGNRTNYKFMKGE